MASVAFVLFMAEDDTVMQGVLDRGGGNMICTGSKGDARPEDQRTPCSFEHSEHVPKIQLYILELSSPTSDFHRRHGRLLPPFEATAPLRHGTNCVR